MSFEGSEGSTVENLPENVTDNMCKQSEDIKSASSETVEKSTDAIYAGPKPRLFNRQKSVHEVLGGGKAADTFLWRNKLMSAGILAGTSAAYILLECSDYTLLSVVTKLLLGIFAVLFVWSNAAALLNRSPPPIPDLRLSEDTATSVALAVRVEVNRILSIARDIAMGKDIKRFLKVAAILYGLSVVGGWFNFLTLVYLAVVVSHIIPVVYERYEDQIEFYAHRAVEQAHTHYRKVDAKLNNKLSQGISKIRKSE